MTHPHHSPWEVERHPLHTPEPDHDLSSGLQRSLPLAYAQLGSRRRMDIRGAAGGIAMVIGLVWVMIAVMM